MTKVVLNCLFRLFYYFKGVGGGEVEYTEDGSVVNHTTVQWMNPRLIYQSNAWAGPDHCKYRNPQGTIYPSHMI